MSLRVRLCEHIKRAKRGYGSHVYRWIAQLLRLGLVPTITVVEKYKDDATARERERYWIAFYREHYTLTNLTDGGEGTKGFKFSDEQRQRLSAAKKGYKQTPEHVESRIKWQRGRIVSEQTKAKIRASMLGQKRTPEQVARIKAGRARSNYVCSEETRRKLSLARMGHPVSLETRRKLSLASTGRPVPLERRLKISASVKAHNAAKKAILLK